MKKVEVGIIGILVSLICLTNSYAQPKIWGGIIVILRPPNPKEARGVVSQLDLTAEQKKQLQELNRKYHHELRNLKNKYQSLYQDLVKAIGNPDLKMGVVQKKAQKLHEVHGKILQKEVEYWNSLKEILKPEQYKKMWNLFVRKRLKK